MSAAIEAAMAKAADTDYVRKYGPDETYWTHFLSHEGVNARSTDFALAADLVASTAPEATLFIDHLRTMASILRYRG